MLNKELYKHIGLLLQRYPELSVIEEKIIEGYLTLEKCYSFKHKVLVAGNGGSAADSEHIVSELMKSFKIERPLNEDLVDKLLEIDPVIGKQLYCKLNGALPAISLTSNSTLMTACINDIDATDAFAQQVVGYGEEGDVFLAISTSGDSDDIIYATVIAKAKGLKVIGLTGNTGGKLGKYVDTLVNVPSKETYMIQELHLPIYHCWCQMLEERFFMGM